MNFCSFILFQDLYNLSSKKGVYLVLHGASGLGKDIIEVKMEKRKIIFLKHKDDQILVQNCLCLRVVALNCYANRNV